jgi:hypothetical protein
MTPQLPFLLPWLRVNCLIKNITSRVWDEGTWPVAKVHLGRALEIRRDLARAPWWN